MYENETIAKMEKCYYMNVTVGSALKGIAQTVGGAALGGIIGRGMMNASQKALNASQIHGFAILTNARFVFGEGGKLKKLAAGAPLTVTPKDEIHFDIPFEAIKSVSLGRHGLYHACVIEVEEREFKFAFSKQAVAEEWVAALQQALGR
jgi:hypothetical protein